MPHIATSTNMDDPIAKMFPVGARVPRARVRAGRAPLPISPPLGRHASAQRYAATRPAIVKSAIWRKAAMSAKRSGAKQTSDVARDCVSGLSTFPAPPAARE